ncbi:hypothetical protein J2764_000269 [Agrobacterium tumefaciens]|nr:hypothetical protein [Agrobacterium tumefaciens]
MANKAARRFNDMSSFLRMVRQPILNQHTGWTEEAAQSLRAARNYVSELTSGSVTPSYSREFRNHARLKILHAKNCRFRAAQVGRRLP